jgi:hypothetical protein
VRVFPLFLGPYIITTAKQPAGAPLVDRCRTRVHGGRRDKEWYAGYAILCTPWNRNEYGDIAEQIALVVGRRETWRTNRKKGGGA